MSSIQQLRIGTRLYDIKDGTARELIYSHGHCADEVIVWQDLRTVGYGTTDANKAWALAVKMPAAPEFVGAFKSITVRPGVGASDHAPLYLSVWTESDVLVASSLNSFDFVTNYSSDCSYRFDPCKAPGTIGTSQYLLRFSTFRIDETKAYAAGDFVAARLEVDATTTIPGMQVYGSDGVWRTWSIPATVEYYKGEGISLADVLKGMTKARVSEETLFM